MKRIGLENVPQEGPVILCSNHFSNWDPPTVVTFLHRKVRFMAKTELFQIPIFGRIIPRLGAYPVNRGGISKESVRKTLQILQNGEMILIFPEGTRRSSGQAAKRGAATFAVRSKAAVVPVAIVGEYKPFRKMKVIYGKPMYFTAEDRAEPAALEAVTEEIMEQIRSMLQEASPD